MRLWSFHPQYLDGKGIVALWREGLLAQKVLLGATVGYKRHPQLIRFLETPDPIRCLRTYLDAVYKESRNRGYRFDKHKIDGPITRGKIALTFGQLIYEWQHLLLKLKHRKPEMYQNNKNVRIPDPNPLFTLVDGGIENWEKLS